MNINLFVINQQSAVHKQPAASMPVSLNVALAPTAQVSDLYIAVLVMMYIAMGRPEVTHAYTYRLAVFELSCVLLQCFRVALNR